MHFLYTPIEAEDYLLTTAKQCKRPTPSGSYTKDRKEFPLDDKFNATLSLEIHQTKTDKTNSTEIVASIKFEDISEDQDVQQTIQGINRELTHIIQRNFPGHIEQTETKTNPTKYKITYQITFKKV